MSNTVPEGWKLSKIGDFAREVNARNSEGKPVPVLSVTKYRGFVLSLDYFKKQVFSRDTGTYKLVRRGQFAYATIHLDEGSLVLLEAVPEGQVSPMYTVFETKPGIDKAFLFSLLKSDDFMRLYPALGQGSIDRRAAIPFKVLADVAFPSPPLPEQQKIAAILSSVDDVIEKTRAQIDKLKDLKTGMMQELLTKGIGSGGVPHTEFKDSPLGRIPSSWNVKSLGALSSFVTSGSRGWAQYYSSSGAIFIRIGNLTREHINLRFDDTVYVTPPASAEGKRTQVTIGDVLISITADLGVIGVVNESIGEAFVNQHISLVRLNEPALARWVGHFLAFENSQKQFIANNDAGAKAGLNLPAIRKTLVAIPAKDEREKIVASLDSVDQDVSLKRDRLQRLLNLKKALMQDLLTGKVRVKVDQKESAVA